MKAQDKSGPQWDPAKVPECMRTDPQRLDAWAEAREAQRQHATAYAAASDRVMRRVEKSVDLDCERMDTPDAYHVTGGKDPDGHTVHLPAEWGFRCTCGDHMMRFAFCKHLMRVGLERGQRFSNYDFLPGGVRSPGLFSQAMQVEMDNAARRAAGMEGA